MNKNQNKKIATVLSAAVITSTALAMTASAAPTSYVVKQGDSLYLLAHAFNTTVDAIARDNGISNKNEISVNQVLTINSNTSYGTIAPTVTESYDEVYTVVAGDTLKAIAARFGQTVANLQTWNNVCNANVIEIGQQLKVGTKKVVTQVTPLVPQTTTQYYDVVAGDTLNYIAARFNTTVAKLMDWNGICNANVIEVGQQLRVGTISTTTAFDYNYHYVVKAGDTLTKIANAHHVTVWQLASWNGIDNVNMIREGEILKVAGY